MKTYMHWIVLIFILSVLLCSCGKDAPGVSGGVELVENENTRLICVTVESSVPQQAAVTLFPMTKDQDGSYILGEEMQAVFDGVDTHYLVVDSGSEYGLKVTAESGREMTFLLVMDESQVFSFHVCLDEKEDTGYRHLWPETPHNNKEP